MKTRILATLITLAVTGLTLAAQDLEFIAALERAQKQRPATLTSTARIAPESEPGSSLVVHGRVVGEDGSTPVAGAIVFAYHTDRTGVYDKPGSGPHSWRLKGWVRTDAQGRFEFRTIRPGAYPSRREAEHIHLNVFLADGRRFSDGVLFADDPLVRAADRGNASQVRRENGVQHVDFTFRLKPANKLG